MIRDVRRQQERIAPSDDALLALIGRVPVDFELQLVGLEDLGPRKESFAELREESHIAMRLGLVVRQSGVGELLRAAGGSSFDERPTPRVVPCLRKRRSRKTHRDA